MPGLAFLCKREVLFVSREKHTDSLGTCGVRHIVNPDRHLSRVKYNQLEVALQARTKSSTRWVDDLADAHLFRPEAFVIDHYVSPSAHFLYFLAQYLIDEMKDIVGERDLTGFGVFFDLLGACRT